MTTCWAGAAACRLTGERDPRSKPIVRGVSLAGAEFGVEKQTFSNRQPGEHGRDYLYNGPRTIEHFARSGFSWLRLPFRWERVQRQLLGPLDKAEVDQIARSAAVARSSGAGLLLDLHNYGRYGDDSVAGRTRRLGDPPDRGLTAEHLIDVWLRLSRSLRRTPGIRALGLMNEPHDLPAGVWERVSQRVVEALRADGEVREIIVSGDDWSSAERFSANHRKPWIDDPLQAVRYEAHCYFDLDGSGKYPRTAAAERAVDPQFEQRGLARVQPFVDWCRRHGVRGFLGEFGVPQQEEWLKLARASVALCDSAAIPVCAWAAGEWWGDYPLSLHPKDGFTRDQPLIDWLRSSASSRSSQR